MDETRDLPDAVNGWCLDWHAAGAITYTGGDVRAKMTAVVAEDHNFGEFAVAATDGSTRFEIATTPQRDVAVDSLLDWCRAVDVNEARDRLLDGRPEGYSLMAGESNRFERHTPDRWSVIAAEDPSDRRMRVVWELTGDEEIDAQVAVSPAADQDANRSGTVMQYVVERTVDGETTTFDSHRPAKMPAISCATRLMRGLHGLSADELREHTGVGARAANRVAEQFRDWNRLRYKVCRRNLKRIPGIGEETEEKLREGLSLDPVLDETGSVPPGNLPPGKPPSELNTTAPERDGKADGDEEQPDTSTTTTDADQDSAANSGCGTPPSEYDPEAVKDIPNGWIVSTNKENNITFLYDEGDGRSVVMLPTRGAEGWNVKGLGGYGPECPLFAEGETFAAAFEAARMEMQARLDGRSIQPVNDPGTSVEDEEDSTIGEADTNDRAHASSGSESELESEGQVTLGDFGGA